jgi:hypothetical protein
MSKRDVIDPELARRFAWRTDEPPAPPEPDDEADEEADDDDLEAATARWDRARRAAQEIAEDAVSAWALRGRASQAAATIALMQRVQRNDDVRVCMDPYPAARLALWRLLVKHHRRLSSRTRNDDLLILVAVRPPLDVPEAADLLAEVIAADDVMLRLLMNGHMERSAENQRHPAVTARLTQILAEGKTWAARESAAKWLTPETMDAAIPALLRAVRQPHLGLRARALTLLAQRSPPAIDADQVRWLLDDALAHPMFKAKTNGQADNAGEYAETLLTLTAALRPAGGFEPLLEIVPWEDHRGENLAGIDSAWALRVLAAAYPDEGAKEVERQLLTHRFWRGRAAVEALLLLREAEARPLLLEAAARPWAEVAERAKAVWFTRFGEACPVSPLDGVPVSLLAGAPSERFVAAVTVLRGASEPARNAMLDAMLAEAPEGGAALEALTPAQREALALWIYAARDLRGRSDGTGVPSRAADLLVERFGASSFPGLALLAERDARAGSAFEWLNVLSDLHKKLPLGEVEREQMREIGRLALRHTHPEQAVIAVSLLHAAGLVPDTIALLIALVRSKDTEDEGSAGWRCAFSAHQVLGLPGDLPGLDEALARAAAEARQAQAWGAFSFLVAAACRRGSPAVMAMAREIFDDPESTLPALRAARSALERRKESVDLAWLLTHLRRPGSLAFSMIANLARESTALEVLDALRVAMESDAREGAAAAEATEQLLRMKAIGAEDRRLDGILERAPITERVDLLGTLLFVEAPLAPFRRHFLHVLSSQSKDTLLSLLWTFDVRKPKGMIELFQDVLPRVTDPDVRHELEFELGEPSERETYWQTGDEDLDEDDDDDEMS